jgi:hypothetical protein
MKLANLIVTTADRISEFKQRNRDYDELSVTPAMSRLLLKSRDRRCWHECYAAFEV